jgi:predicted CoA-binding protein
MSLQFLLLCFVDWLVLYLPQNLLNGVFCAMNHDSYDDIYIRTILDEVKTIAIVGASPKNVRPSYFVTKYLIDKGYKVFPVNPGHADKKICGAMTFDSLADIPDSIDMIDIFRSSSAVPGIIGKSLKLEVLPKVIWMQLGVRDDEIAGVLETAGIKVVMNRCPKIEYGRFSGEIGWTGVNRKILSSKKPKLAGGFQHFGLRK